MAIRAAWSAVEIPAKLRAWTRRQDGSGPDFAAFMRQSGSFSDESIAVSDPIHIRMGGYGPATTSFSRALQRIGDRLEAELAGRVEVHYVWNILDFGYRAEDILWLVENGILTLGYQSSSYLADRIPELGLVDLPFLFATTQQAQAAIDGALGAFLTRALEHGTGYRI